MHRDFFISSHYFSKALKQHSAVFYFLMHQILVMDYSSLIIIAQNFRTFEKLAVEVLNECYETDQRRATLLLVTPYKDYEDATLLEMAVQAGNEHFISHFVVQKLLTNIWIGNISDENSYIRVGFKNISRGW